jgi:hypothetical protein
MYKKAITFFLFLQFFLAGCIKNNCTDDTNPDCSNYNPCKKNIETSASFKIYDRIAGNAPIGWVWQDTDTVSIGAIFEADMPYKADGSITYEWHIGAGIYYSKLVEIPDGMPLNKNLSAMLIVRNSKVNKLCFPNDDGIDTIIRNYYTSSSYSRMNGLYRGAYSSKPFDSFDFVLNIDSTRTFLPSNNCRNFLGITQINNGTFSALINSTGFQYEDTSVKCKINSAMFFFLNKNSINFKIKFNTPIKISDSVIEGRKIKSL